MGKYYKDSLKGKLTRSLLIFVLLVIALMGVGALFIFIYYLELFNKQTELWCLNLGNINSQYKLMT
jgi:hypothetical protein